MKHTHVTMNATTERQVVLVLLGPTGIGKTAISRHIAQRVPVEIISADSRQIYKYMDIGTDKPSEEFRREVPHHFVDMLPPDVPFSAGEFAQQARKVVREIQERNRLPFVVGGSGLYIRALLEGFFGQDIKDEAVRQHLYRRVEREGAEALYAELQQVDPESAAHIHPRNVKRLVRALEVFHISGKPLSYWHRQQRDPAPFPYIKIGLSMARPALYERINQRVEAMFDAGLIEETRRLLEMGFSPELNALNTVGYKETIQFLQNELDLYTCVELVKRNTRRYAKRQFTWFRAEKHVHWLDLPPDYDPAAIAEQIIEWWRMLEPVMPAASERTVD